ncbi:hypothetical protein PTKIN_Ptkin07bG0018700 [Pterospermum kingtungense]
MEEGMNNGNASESSSPPTPPSPLPISVGPGNEKYLFSSSPTPSPPFSPLPSSHESSPLLHDNQFHPTSTPLQVRSAFSVDRKDPDELEEKTSCLKDLLEWLVEKCCNCRSRSFHG